MKVSKVIKRNGVIEDFSEDKIINTVKAAFDSVNKSIPDKAIKGFVDQIVEVLPEIVDVEYIQDKIEKELMRRNCFSVARAFILYREEHKEARLLKDRLSYMMDYLKSDDNAATSSEEDPNANVSTKNVANLNGETYKALNRRLQRMWMKNQLNRKHPELAKQYERDINSHIMYVHDEASFSVPTNYCCAVSMYPLLMNGTSTMDGLRTTPPKNLNSFCGQLVNLTFLLAAQCKGAVAFGEFFNFFDYFCTKEWGENWDLKLDQNVYTDVYKRERTVKDVIEQAFQQIVFSWNQPAGNRSFQSPFINISYYDSNYWKALFEDFCFPDGTKPEWRRVNVLQKMFMKWFNATRKKTLMAFPVETMALLTDGKDVIDKEYKNFTAEMWAEGHSFFVYLSDSPDSLSSCCFSPDTKVLWKSSTRGVQLTSLKELDELNWETDKKNLKIFHNGFWISGKTIKTDNTDFYIVKTANHKTFYMTDNHINVTFDGEKKTKDLKVGDYLMFNTHSLQAVPENDEHLTYEQGFTVGAFLGNGSFGTRFKDGTIYDISYSQNSDNYTICMDMVSKANKQLGNDNKCVLNAVYNNVYPVRISSKELVSFIQRWTNWTEGTYANNKELNLDCLLQSYEFRKGILDGWYCTDGGNSNRCYTTSEKLKDCMEVLITSLGMNSIIDISDRTDEKITIRGKKYNRQYPLWCIRWYDPCNKRNASDIYKWKNNSQYFMITSIEHLGKCPDEQYSYCIECTDQSNPYFTLPSGLITHNCRLRNQIDKNEFSFTNGLTGVKTGSCNVLTLNLNRILQNFFRENWESMPSDIASENWENAQVKNSFKIYLTEILERLYIYHKAYKDMLYDIEEKGMLTASKAGYISMSDLYSTIGINGLNEAAEFLGIECSDNPEYKEFVRFITGTISEENKKHSSRKYKFNMEFVPAETLGSKNYMWDKNDGYVVNPNRVLYNSYFYLAEDPNTSVLEKLRLHGRDYTELLDGGVGCHINLEEHLSKSQYLKILDYAIKVGCSYFTFNVPNTECLDCGNIEKVPVDECPKCGSKNVTQWTRVIGYLRPIKNFDKYRQIEAKSRIYSKEVK